MKIFSKSLELARALYPDDFKDRLRTFHISAVWNKNKLLAVAENRNGTHPRNLFNLKDFDISMKNQCSELRVFLAIKNKFENPDWSKLTMVNIRIDRNGNIRNSCPCNSCRSLICYANPRSVYYTDDTGNFIKY